MISKTSPVKGKFNKRQLAFKELFVGILVYCVVLGFLNDYTNVVYAKSFSTIFMASVVLEILTYFTLLLKSKVIRKLAEREGLHIRAATVFIVWLILFLSKFVFIWVIDLVFGSYMNIHGFFGVLFLVLSVTIIQQLADIIFIKLGE